MAQKFSETQPGYLGKEREERIADELERFRSRNSIRTNPDYVLATASPVPDRSAAVSTDAVPVVSETQASASATPKRKLFGRK